MTNLFTLRYKYFWPALAVCLLPFVVLAFLDSLAMEDYFYYNHFRQLGFWGAQRDFYVNWAGRYTSTFITGVFVTLDLPARFPFLPTLCYFAFTFLALVYLLRSLRPMLPGGFLDHRGTWRAAAVLFVVFLYVQPDIATGFYWLCSTSVYQTAFILFLLLLATILRRIGNPRSFAPRDLLFFLLVILLAGCNELIAVFVPLFLAALGVLLYRWSRRVDRWLWLGLAIAVGMGILIYLTSGVMHYRQGMLNSHNGFGVIVPVIGLRTVEVFFDIFKEPLFWGCAIAVFAAGVQVSSRIADSPQVKELGPLTLFQQRKLFLPGFAALVSVVILSLAAFLFASRGSIPPRALNNLCDVSACCLLALCFLAGIHAGVRLTLPAMPALSSGLQMALLAVFLLASTNYAQAWKSVGSGYVFHAVVAEREEQLKTAASEHRHVAVVPSYDSAWKSEIKKILPHGHPVTVREWLQEKPTLLVVYDGALFADTAYAHFYGLDSVIVGDK